MKTRNRWSFGLIPSHLVQFLFCAAVALSISLQSRGATYYVSTQGSDSGPGTQSQPWRNIDYAAGRVQPGDTVIVRGGIYYEMVTSRVNGTSSARITFKAYPGETPILDGTTVITGWTRCTSASDFLRPDGTSIGSFAGNSNYANIYKAQVPTASVGDGSDMAIYENGEYLFTSSNPSQANNVFDDETTYKPMSSSSYGQTTNFTDPALTQPSGFWVGATAKVWVHANNNTVTTRKVSAFASGKVTLSSALPAALGNTGTMPDAYALQNHWSLLNKKGTVYHTTKAVNGFYTVYVWPNNTVNLQGKICVSNKDMGFWMQNGSYVTIDGFVIRGIADRTDSQTHRSGGVVNVNNYKHTGLEVRNCKVINSSCVGGITLWAGTNDVIENNYVANCRSGYGIAMRGTETARNYGCIIRNNTLNNVRSTGLKIIYATNIQITGNTASEFGSHGNGCSLYQFNDQVLFAHNAITRARNALTIKESSNMTIYSNLLQGSGSTASGSYVLAAWAAGSGTPMSGKVNILNNIIMSEFGNIALFISNSPQTKAAWVIKNNILDGMIVDAGVNPTYSHNLYVDYSWVQAKSTYSLKTGELHYENLANVFVNAGTLNFYHPSGGYALSKGTDVRSYLPTTQFSGYNFNVALNNTARSWSSVDLGCYQGTSGSTTPPAEPPVANAGPDQAVAYANRAQIQLDGSGSSGSGELLYAWTLNNTLLSNEQKPVISLINPGTYEIVLTVKVKADPTLADNDSVTITVEAQPAAADVRAGLVGEWTFCEKTGPVTTDGSGNANFASLTKDSMWTSEGSVDINGVQDYLECPASQSLNLTSSLTLSAWVNPRSYGEGNYGRIVDKGVGSSGRGFTFMLDGSAAAPSYLIYGGAIASGTSNSVPLNTWTHVCVVHDTAAGTAFFYVNGQPAGSAVYTRRNLDTLNDPLYLGIRGYDKMRSFDGQIDGVRIYNRAVSAAEAGQIYQLGREGSVAGQWRFDDGLGNSARDSSGCAQTAVLLNNPQWGRGWAGEEFIRLSGANQAVRIPMTGTKPDEGTVAVWAMPEDLSSTCYIFGHAPSSTNRICLYTVSGQLTLAMGDRLPLKQNIAALQLNTLYHIALTWNKGKYEVFLDGQSVDSGSYTSVTSLNAVADLGNTGNSTRETANSGFKGIFEEAALYSRALTAKEIAQLFLTYEVTENRPLNFSVSGAVAYQASGLPDGAVFDQTGQTLDWIPRYNQAGDYQVLFTAQDQSDQQKVNLTVRDAVLQDWYRQLLIQAGKL
ncbi:MAG: right-handed parallel beta-helix repeat-containing protein [Planctomycetaceae bacterium]|nr:right-handed parallel beta-helix repeat-containing protein [Planctomycetaceae bacterium]